MVAALAGCINANGTTGDMVGVQYAGDIACFASASRPANAAENRVRQIRQSAASTGFRSAVQLHAMPLDWRAREAASCLVFRAAGVLAPRTAFAEVALTVPGKHDKAYLGLFTVVENVDPICASTIRFGSDQDWRR